MSGKGLLHGAGFVLLCMCTAARAELQIAITRGVTDPLPVAVAPFARAVPADGGLDVAAVMQRDLDEQWALQGADRASHAGAAQRANAVDATAPRDARTDYVVVGRLVTGGADTVTLHFDLA